MRWTLTEGEREVAKLAQRGLALLRADLETASRAWRIETRGLARSRLVLLATDGTERAVMPLDWRGAGVIRLTDGRSFEWVPTSWWASRYALRSAGRDVARVTGDGWFRLAANVEALDDALSEDDLVPLLALGWFAAILMTMGSAAVVTG